MSTLILVAMIGLALYFGTLETYSNRYGKGNDMGVISHKSLIVTGWDKDQFNHALAKAEELFNTEEYHLTIVNPVTALNGHRSFVVTPDGSKEGWEESNAVDANLTIIMEYLTSPDCVFEDSSTSLDWVLVQYGDEGSRVLQTNTRNKY